MPISFTTRTLTVAQLLSGDSLYHMPAFQRPYSWKEEQVLQLYDDFHCGLNSDSDSFLGPIVVSEQNRLGPADVVDGQQRLVTLTLMLAVLRDISSDEKFKKSLDGLIWRHEDSLLAPEETPRVVLKEIDQDRMLTWVHQRGGTRSLPGTGDSESTNNLLTNIKALKKEIGVVGDEYLKNLAEYILKKCYIIKIVSQDPFEAYKIFKSINTIGQPLTEMDLIRGELVNPSVASNEEAKKLAETWDKIEEELGYNELESYIKIVLSTIDNELSLKELRDAFRVLLASPNQLADFRKKLSDFIRSYGELKTATLNFGEDSREINRLVQCIEQAPFENWYSVSLLWLASNRHGRDTLHFFRALDALCLGLRILKQTQKTKLNKRFSAIEDRIRDGSVLSSGQSELYLSNNEKHLIRTTLEGQLKRTDRFLIPLLLRINVEMQNPVLPIYFPSKITLEHILPQKPKKNSEWLEMFPDENDREILCNSLGNFTILTGTVNSRIKNSDFRKKLEGIFSVEGAEMFAITSVLNKYSNWTPESIKTRQTELVDVSRKILQI